MTDLERKAVAKKRSRLEQLEAKFGTFDALAVKVLAFSYGEGGDVDELKDRIKANPFGDFQGSASNAQLAKHLDISVADVIVLQGNAEYQKALERQIARSVYTPLSQMLAISHIGKIAMGMDEKARAADSILADKHLRTVTMPPTERDNSTSIGITVTFEGLNHTEVRNHDEDAIDVEFRSSDEETPEGKNRSRRSNELPAGASNQRKAPKVSHRFAREGDEPSNSSITSYQDYNESELDLFGSDEDSPRLRDERAGYTTIDNGQPKLKEDGESRPESDTFDDVRPVPSVGAAARFDFSKR